MSITPVASTVTSSEITFFQHVTGAASLFTNTRAGSVFVITFVNLINTTSSSGQTIVISDAQTSVGFHSGNVGAGSADRFPLNCEVSVQTGHGVTATAVSGGWDVTITGHYAPAFNFQ